MDWIDVFYVKKYRNKIFSFQFKYFSFPPVEKLIFDSINILANLKPFHSEKVVAWRPTPSASHVWKKYSFCKLDPIMGPSWGPVLQYEMP